MPEIKNSTTEEKKPARKKKVQPLNDYHDQLVFSVVNGARIMAVLVCGNTDWNPLHMLEAFQFMSQYSVETTTVIAQKDITVQVWYFDLNVAEFLIKKFKGDRRVILFPLEVWMDSRKKNVNKTFQLEAKNNGSGSGQRSEKE